MKKGTRYMNILLHLIKRSLITVKFIYYFIIYMGLMCLDMHFIILLMINQIYQIYKSDIFLYLILKIIAEMLGYNF